MVISILRMANCSLKSAGPTLSDAEVVVRGPPERVRVPSVVSDKTRLVFEESCTLILVHQVGDKLLLRLNICGKPIANKYCEGKMKSTLKRGSKDLKSLGRKR
jgi:hypothetical protein